MTGGDDIYTLVVDDSEFFAEMTAETLSNEHGMRTRSCNSVPEAREALTAEPVDCIVSDYEMPGENGIAFLNWVRDRYEELPFILLTGRGDEEIASEAIASGVADYLLKLEVVEDKQYERLANRIRSVVEQHRAQHKYQRLIDNSPDAIAHVGADGEVMAANRTLAAWLDQPRDQLTGAMLTEILPEAVGNDRLAAGQEAIDLGEATESDDSYGDRYFHNTFVPLEVRTERESFQLISRDVTERKQRERELRRQNERLETFASVVTHDLRNPLNVASGSLEMLEPEVGQTDAYERIDRSLDRMDVLIDDVLTLARQGEQVTEPTAVDVPSIAEAAWANVEAGSATLRTDGSATIHADAGRLQQLFENLFRNAIEHGGPDVSVTVETDGEDRLFVADDGPGIDPTAREAVLELGYSTSQGGTGIGLAIVSQIATAHGWELDVTESEAGGARFEFSGVTFP